MNRIVRTSASALALASLVFLSACNKEAGDASPAANANRTAAKVDDETDGKADTGLRIAGLPTEKQQVSYMIGMGMGKQLQMAKDEVDVDTIARAIKATLAGEKLLMTEEQAQQVAQKFGQKMQDKQVKEMEAQAKKNADEGAKFLAENAKKPEVKTTASGLQYQALSQGKGAKPKENDTVKVHYKGETLDGKVFDSSYDRGEPALIPLPNVVPGWREGIQLMPVGSKYKLWLPANLAYGENVPPGAPFGANATLVFEVELLGIETPQAEAKPKKDPPKKK